MIALVFAAAVAGTAPTFPSANVYVFSSGNTSCAAWVNQKEYRQGREAWVLGYWSALNVAFGRNVGANTDAEGVLGEIDKDCAAQPSEALFMAVNGTFRRLAVLGR